MSGETMQGTRRPDGTWPHELAPGEYSLESDTMWFCLPSGEVGHVVQPTWTITVEDNDTITVSPSIFANARGNPPGWHGFLERGVWRPC